MNMRSRRRQVFTAVDLLMEMVEEVLQDAYDDNVGGLTATAVAARAGFPNEGDRGQLARYVLRRLLLDGVAVNDQPQQGAGSWRLSG